jgi:hypothetical protein
VRHAAAHAHMSSAIAQAPQAIRQPGSGSTQVQVSGSWPVGWAWRPAPPPPLPPCPSLLAPAPSLASCCCCCCCLRLPAAAAANCQLPAAGTGADEKEPRAPRAACLHILRSGSGALQANVLWRRRLPAAGPAWGLELSSCGSRWRCGCGLWPILPPHCWRIHSYSC